MAIFNNMSITNKGQILYAKAQAGTKLNFTKIMVGSGQIENRNPAILLALLEPKFSIGIQSITPNTELKTATISATINNSEVTEAVYICEIGLYAEDPDDGEILYAYGSAGTYGDYYAPASQGAYSWNYQINAAIGNAANVTIELSNLSYDYAVINSNTTFTVIGGGNQKEINKSIDNKISELTKKSNDLTSDSYPIVEATGTNAYIGASARIKAVGKGTRCTLFVGTASNGNCSLNLNNSGAVAIKDSNGNVVANMKANIPYNLCHNGSDFILQGKGGGGNLIPKYLLAGYYGEGDNGRVDGAMVNRGAPTSNLNCGGVVNLQEGYYAGGQIIANSLASQTGGATADDTKVLNGYKYWKDGVLRTGNATIQSLGGGTDIQCNPVRYRSSSNMPTGTYVIDAREFKILNPYYISDSNARCCVAISGELRSSTGLKNITDFVQSTRGTQYVTIYSSDSENVSKYGYLDGYCFWLILR